jgi:hypothetical protein
MSAFRVGKHGWIVLSLLVLVVGALSLNQGWLTKTLKGELSMLENEPAEDSSEPVTANMLVEGCATYCNAGDASGCGNDSDGFPCNWCNTSNYCKPCIRAGDICGKGADTCCPKAYADETGESLSCSSVGSGKRCCLPDGATCEGLADGACCSGDCDDRFGFTDTCDDTDVSAVDVTIETE